MCNECRRIFCAPRCPEYDGRSAARGPRRKRCSVCGRNMYGGEVYTVVNHLAVCEECTTKVRKTDHIKGISLHFLAKK